jgi:hypothetical protein
LSDEKADTKEAKNSKNMVFPYCLLGPCFDLAILENMGDHLTNRRGVLLAKT